VEAETERDRQKGRERKKGRKREETKMEAGREGEGESGSPKKSEWT